MTPEDDESSTIENLNAASNPMKLNFLHLKTWGPQVHSYFSNEPIIKSRSLFKPSESLFFRHFWRQSIHIKHRSFLLQTQLPKFPPLPRVFDRITLWKWILFCYAFLFWWSCRFRWQVGDLAEFWTKFILREKRILALFTSEVLVLLNIQIILKWIHFFFRICNKNKRW